MVLIAAVLPLSALLALFGALLPGSGGAEISVYPQNAIIPRGGSMNVTCNASCDQTAVLGLETELTKTQVANGTNWVTYEVSDMQNQGTLMCFSNCHTKQVSTLASFSVYWFPESVELAPLPHWQPVGEEFTVRCQVKGGGPRTSLSVVLLQGEKLLSRQPVVGEPAEVTATVLASRDDHGTSFSCHTELDLRSQGLELFQNSSVPRQLQTFVLPKMSPHLATPQLMEVGTEWPVNCTLDGLFPVSEAQVHLALGAQRLEPTVKYSKDSLWATAWVKVSEGVEGIQQLTCAVMLGSESRRTQEKVIIYSFPAPSLTLSESQVPEGTTVTVQCKAHAGAVVKLSRGPDGPPARSDQFDQFILNASAEDNRRNFSCSATLKVAGKVLHKTKTQELLVLYGPRLDERDCPGNWTWQEGSQQTLRCQAWGNPIPKLNCQRKKDGASLPIGDLKPVTRSISGTYVCQASSRRRVVTREVVVHVIYHQNNTAIITGVTVVAILVAAVTAVVLYNRQRKIREYKLQKAQAAAAMKLNTPP